MTTIITDKTGRAKRKEILGVFSGIGMIVNGIIGVGIFTTPGIVLKTLNSPQAALTLWAIGGILAIAASFSYAEIGATVGQSGGEIGYFWYLGKHHIRKKSISKILIFVSYLFSIIIILVILPGRIRVQLLITTKYFMYTSTNDPSERQYNADWKGGWSTFRFNLIAISILVIITGYQIPSSRVANIINQTIAVMKLVILFIIAIVGLVKLPSVLKDPSNVWSSSGFDDTKGVQAFSSAFILVMSIYDGWNVLNYALDEFKEPRKKMIISNLSGIIAVTTLYILVNIAFISVVPKDLILDDSKVIATHFFEQLFGEKGGQISSFIITLSSIGTISLYVFVGSRAIAYAAQRDYIPFFSDELKWRSIDKSPKNALIAQFMWCSLLIILVKDETSSSYYGSFSNTANYSSLTIFTLTGFVLLLLRLNRSTEEFRFYKKDYNILILLFIAGRICGFVLPNYDATCPENVSNCEEYLEAAKIGKLASYFTCGVFIAISTVCYFIIYRILRNKEKKDDDSGDDDDDDDDDGTSYRKIKEV